jgi:biopolymer transport protein ExbD
MSHRSGRAARRRLEPSDSVMFPVTPMLDMAFQLLAFFILTFQAPSNEASIDLYLPTVAMALPKQDDSGGPTRAEGDLIILARADDTGKLLSLSLNDRPLLGPAELSEALSVLREGRPANRPLRVAILADDHLRYEEAARVLGACAAAGVVGIRLADPTAVEATRP